MDQKEPRGENSSKLRIKPHYQRMNNKGREQLTEALATIIVGYLEKEENDESRILSKKKHR